MERWFYIDIHYATFGICSKDDIVIKTAPIAKWMLGEKLTDIKPFLLKKKAKVVEIT